jgi:uncharacterized coiled-coil protein SlyX
MSYEEIGSPCPLPKQCYLEAEVQRLNQKSLELERRLFSLETRVADVVANVVGEHMKHFAASVGQGTESMGHFQADVKDLLQGLSQTVEKAAEELNRVTAASAARRAKRRAPVDP